MENATKRKLDFVVQKNSNCINQQLSDAISNYHFYFVSDIKDPVIIILSQPNEHHLKQAELLKEEIENQGDAMRQGPIVHLSHRDFPHVGHWTILPLLSKVWKLHQNASWFVFFEDRTRVFLEPLYNILDKYDANKAIWLGHALYDSEPTIIHHFAFYDDPKKFKYPNLASGIAISKGLLKRLIDRLKEQTTLHSDFGIDSSHELALFIWDNEKGKELTHEEGFCIEKGANCATFPIPFKKCDKQVDPKSVYFAVKTCKKYHKDRVPFVKKTWGKYAHNIEFFSDVADDTIPTINLGIPNTEQGHCAKSLAILKHVNDKLFNSIEWVVLADDDTILGIGQLLTCYNSSKLVALGERYGYNVYNSRGYNYLTGGGGMVFSRKLLEKLTREGTCQCPSLDTPDDMFLGLCIDNLGVSVTHSPLFHQARPMDYPSEYLQTKDAVSFHKHWMLDPYTVYEKWFAEEDLKFAKRDLHTEL